MNVYLCALCDGRGPLIRLRPSKWYACKDCMKRHGSHDDALLAIVERLKVLVLKNDPRVDTPSVLAAVQSLSKDLQARVRGTA